MPLHPTAARGAIVDAPAAGEPQTFDRRDITRMNWFETFSEIRELPPIAAAALHEQGFAVIDGPVPASRIRRFDAPPGTGDDRNRERISIVADEKGGAHLRFLDRRTSVASRMYLDEQNQVWLSFSDFTTTPARIRRYGLAGEEAVPLP